MPIRVHRTRQWLRDQGIHLAGGLLATALIWLASPALAKASTETVQNAKTFPPDASQQPIPPTRCSTGSGTELELGGISRSNRHNGNDGEAHFVLKNSQNGSVLWKDEFVGEGRCFGYNAQQRAFVIGTRAEHGVSIRLDRVSYLIEATRSVRTSAFNRSEAQAFTATASEDLRFLAFIAIKDNKVGLFLLDVARDSLQRLGDAPPPPPLAADDRDLLESSGQGNPWRWMGSFRDSYTELDAGIITFRDSDTLEVSYGKDTASQRAQMRKIVTWDLRKHPATRVASIRRTAPRN